MIDLSKWPIGVELIKYKKTLDGKVEWGGTVSVVRHTKGGQVRTSAGDLLNWELVIGPFALACDNRGKWARADQKEAIEKWMMDARMAEIRRDIAQCKKWIADNEEWIAARTRTNDEHRARIVDLEAKLKATEAAQVVGHDILDRVKDAAQTHGPLTGPEGFCALFSVPLTDAERAQLRGGH